MDIYEKMKILTAAARYDASCASSAVSRGNTGSGGIGSALPGGCCHSFSADGRCISLLKILYSNSCAYDCRYCVNRRSRDFRRAAFGPRELAELTVQFYRRNYIEGLFLSSAVVKNPDYTTERMIEVLRILRDEYGFHGYIHAKSIPGADSALTRRLGQLADRLSVNIELPSCKSLGRLAPDKTRESILAPMGCIRDGIREQREDMVRYRHTPSFAPAGQSTQMIIGASPETDYHILRLSEGLYRKYGLKRVYFSAYTPMVKDSLLPALNTRPPLLREYRLYQADWLMRFYRFRAEEILDPEHPMLHPRLDPKCGWALAHLDTFPVEVNSADYELLLRVPGVGVTSAKRIVRARRDRSLDFDGLRRIGVVLKRARFFLTCSGRAMQGLPMTPESAFQALASPDTENMLPGYEPEQLSLWDAGPAEEDVVSCLTGQL